MVADTRVNWKEQDPLCPQGEIFVFSGKNLIRNTDCFCIPKKLGGLCNPGGVCSLRGTNWICIYSLGCLNPYPANVENMVSS